MKNFQIKNIILAMFIITALASCKKDDDNQPLIIPETISISETGLYPEGIDFNTKNNQFIISSIKRSEVGYIDSQTGAYTTFIVDTNLVSVTGVFVDEDRDRLLVASGNLGFSANSTPNTGTVAYLGIYELETGALIKGVNLKDLLSSTAAVFANDIAVDDSGNIYVTDSFSPVIYKVDVASLEASIFINGGDDFTPAPMAFGLNGIVFTNGNLVVSKTDDGALYKIPVSNPNDFTKINAPAFIGGDGLELTNDGDIVLVENGLGANPGTKLLSSDDNWNSATLVSFFAVDPEKFPTTAAITNDGVIYVLNAHLGLALGGDFTQNTFSIVRTN